MMEIMDSQVNGIFRQPAVMVAYTGLRKKYASLEKQYARQLYEQRTGKVWESSMTDGVRKEDWESSLSFAEKYFLQNYKNLMDG